MTAPEKDDEATLAEQSVDISAKSAADEWAHHPDNPLGWSRAKKWRNVIIVSGTGFVSTAASTTLTPAVPELMAQFDTQNRQLIILTTSLYVLGLGAGPFLFAPIAEARGRRPAYVSSMVCFTFIALGSSFTQSIGSLIALRFLSGVFSSVGPGLGAASVSDCFAKEERGRPISLYALGPLLGPTLWSMLSFWIIRAGWRWSLRIVCFMGAANLGMIVIGLNESYAPVLQRRLSLRDDVQPSETWSQKLTPSHKTRTLIKRTFSRPPRLLLTNPVAAFLATFYAYLYGIIYLVLVSFPTLYGPADSSTGDLPHYSWPRRTTLGLAYSGLLLGFLTSATIASVYQDRIYKRLSARTGGKGQPEYRLILTQIGVILLPIGLLIFGWSAEANTHWIVPQIGSFLFALGLMLAFNSIQNYIVDAFVPYSAAAMAGATAARSVTGAILPIFAEDMFKRLGWGLAGTLLAAIAAIAIPVPLLLLRYGQSLRERFAFVD
ncbi:uncharacterized protein L969DRAFT_52281 [Mixia osmundae IAM 14324]|uniref:Major facilitator superfamily (MFS) profile domain-containing protein n=1 Tax=Mixia osmundae (strain CBS 9802 / IAM 14324 / JCM 22182 / KY 12970) TaxID=764103 RepID=G7E4N4_MIXOS|nr:uncharacterized protein L969DRAFT_52281 [Mixia osmundae IAM 14324]KEI37689.1 hypothetical protein L969DRAFT_52281 [Mixia osmundae IAM 14324]GAA97794.1 hypothetical protein E5Q_04473 [Mixia osmundae IAM 14324]